MRKGRTPEEPAAEGGSEAGGHEGLAIHGALYHVAVFDHERNLGVTVTLWHIDVLAFIYTDAKML